MTQRRLRRSPGRRNAAPPASGGEFQLGEAEWDAKGLEAVCSCPVCGSERRAILYHDLRDYVVGAPGRWTLWRCRACRSGYLDPRPTSDSVGLAYTRYYTHSTEAPALGRVARVRRRLAYGYLNRAYGYGLAPAWKIGAWVMRLLPGDRGRAKRIIRHIPKMSGTPRLIDVGSGNGAYLALMQWQGWEVLGIDFDPVASVEAKHREVTVIAGSDKKMDDMAPESFDAVTINHALEHSDNPLGMIRRAHFVLRDGGLLWIATPNLDSSGHRRFGRNWRGLEPPRHFVLLTRSALEALVIDVGFDIVEVAPPSWDEAWYYRACHEIEDRQGLVRGPLLPIGLEVLLANCRNWLRPDGSEEVALLARRRPREEAPGGHTTGGAQQPSDALGDGCTPLRGEDQRGAVAQ